MSDFDTRENEAIRDAQAAMQAPNRLGNKSVTLDESRNKGGRPRGFDGRKSKMPSAMAQAFKRAGLDWQVDFALAIKANNRNRIKLWLKLLPYLITTSVKRGKRWKGKPSKAALIALQALEGRE